MELTAQTRQQSTTAQWLAAILRSIATRLDGCTIAPPTLAVIKRERLDEARTALRDSQIALLDAQAEAERYAHSTAMLQERVARLGASN